MAQGLYVVAGVDIALAVIGLGLVLFAWRLPQPTRRRETMARV